jgi:hypothetical protein
VTLDKSSLELVNLQEFLHVVTSVFKSRVVLIFYLLYAFHNLMRGCARSKFANNSLNLALVYVT